MRDVTHVKYDRAHTIMQTRYSRNVLRAGNAKCQILYLCFVRSNGVANSNHVNLVMQGLSCPV